MELKYPNAHKAEQYILGCTMNSINAANFCLAALEEDDFDLIKHRNLFKEVQLFYKTHTYFSFEPFLFELMENKKIDHCGGKEFILSIYMEGSSSDHEFYCKKIKEAKSRRSIMNLCRKSLEDSAQEKIEPQEIVLNIQKALYGIQGIHDFSTKYIPAMMDKFEKERSFEEQLRWMISEVGAGRKPYSGVSSGYDLLDEMFGYFRQGAIYYIGGRTSMGKTTFALNLMLNMAERNSSIGFFSLEMPSTRLLEKLLCYKASVSYENFEDGKLSPQQYHKILCVGEEMKKYKIAFEDEQDITISKLRARARRLKETDNIEVLFIDYLTRIKSDNMFNNKHLMVDEVSKGLQSLAKELNIPVICLAQLSRDNAKFNKDSGVKAPSLTDFRESGSIEEDADGCIFVHRPEYYNAYQKPGIIEICIAKNRIRGKLGKIEFHRHPSSFRWEELRSLKEEIEEINERNPGEKDPEAEYEKYKYHYDNKKY